MERGPKPKTTQPILSPRPIFFFSLYPASPALSPRGPVGPFLLPHGPSTLAQLVPPHDPACPVSARPAPRAPPLADALAPHSRTFPFLCPLSSPDSLCSALAALPRCPVAPLRPVRAPETVARSPARAPLQEASPKLGSRQVVERDPLSQRNNHGRNPRSVQARHARQENRDPFN